MTPTRIATWNLKGRSGDAAARLGSLLADLGGADLILLQEASHRGIQRFCDAAGLDWHVHVRHEFPDLLHARGRSGGVSDDGTKHGLPRSVAMAGRGTPPRGATAFPDVPLPEKLLAGWVDVGGARTTVVTYHAPTGVQHQLKKPEQAVRVAEWLASLSGPVILGGDFNTPVLDPPERERLRTHWHSGDDHLEGNPGDDLLIGPDPIHTLRDAYRTWLAAHPDELAAIAVERPDGPLTVTHRTSDRDDGRFRYDQIWLSQHFEVVGIGHHFDAAIEAGTDHALVMVDVELTPLP